MTTFRIKTINCYTNHTYSQGTAGALITEAVETDAVEATASGTDLECCIVLSLVSFASEPQNATTNDTIFEKTGSYKKLEQSSRVTVVPVKLNKV